jgi:2,3-dihydroxybiphenyl 1,2-dioxygenase
MNAGELFVMSQLSFAYLGLGVPDVPAWVRFATDVLGLEDSGDDGNGGRAMRLDDRAWRIGVHPAPAGDILYAGYELPDEAAVSAMAKSIETSGASVRKMTAAETAKRKVAGGVALKDPDGLDIELVHGLQKGARPFVSPTGTKFVTGKEGLGHVVISTTDVKRSLAFYEKLGFRISDYIDFKLSPEMTVKLVFLHCNPRHHTLAFLPLPTPRRLDHLMLEVTSIDEALGGYYRAQKNKAPMVRHMGRHTNDQMLSFYAKTPGGFDVEYGCDGVKVGGDWKVQTYNAISIWGHEP